MTDEAFESRLDRIEALVERNSEQIQANSQQIQANSQQIGALTDKSDAFQRALNGVIEIVGLTAGQLNEITDRLDSLTERVDSLAASAEQHDRILDYLLRRDGGGALE